jgi:Secretion system C-terminal sorting domain
VTFQLDASQVAGTTEAAISGSFNAYCADCAPMTLNGGIWSSIQMLIPGVYEYYFTLNNGATAETLQDGICTVNNNNVYHRIITVTDATTVDVVCFNSCSACIISVEEINGNDLLMFPNPANNELHVQGTAIADGVFTVRNAAGQLVENGKTYHNQNLTVQVSRFESGVYTISIPTVLGMTNKTFVVLR